MKTLLDNTTLHRIYSVLNLQKPSSAIHAMDVIALFHFAEHILFAEGMDLVSFSEHAIQEKSMKANDWLYSAGYTVGSHGESLLQIIKYSDDEYAKACEVAAPKVIEDILSTDINTLKKCGRLLDETSTPIGATATPALKWLTKASNKINRSVLKEQSLAQKATGAFDYTVCINDALYEQLRLLGSKVKGTRHEVARAVNIFFRTAINQALASQREAYYSPAPQRGRIIYESDQLFRHALSKRIQHIASPAREKYVARFLKSIQENETIALPIFAIHFLRKAKIRNPPEMLEAARKLRDDSEVKSIRKWLRYWEQTYNASELNKRRKALDYLDEISQDLQIDLQRKQHLLFSILRLEVSTTPQGMEFKPDLPMLVENIYILLRRLRRRKIFLSTLTKEFTFDKDLGRDVITMIGRAIIK